MGSMSCLTLIFMVGSPPGVKTALAFAGKLGISAVSVLTRPMHFYVVVVGGGGRSNRCAAVPRAAEGGSRVV